MSDPLGGSNTVKLNVTSIPSSFTVYCNPANRPCSQLDRASQRSSSCLFLHAFLPFLLFSLLWAFTSNCGWGPRLSIGVLGDSKKRRLRQLCSALCPHHSTWNTESRLANMCQYSSHCHRNQPSPHQPEPRLCLLQNGAPRVPRTRSAKPPWALGTFSEVRYAKHLPGHQETAPGHRTPTMKLLSMLLSKALPLCGLQCTCLQRGSHSWR